MRWTMEQDQYLPRTLPGPREVSLQRYTSGGRRGSDNAWPFIGSSTSSRTVARPQCEVVILSLLDTVFGPRSSKLSLMGAATLMARGYHAGMTRGGMACRTSMVLMCCVGVRRDDS